jgi:hypothetical protein
VSGTLREVHTQLKNPTLESIERAKEKVTEGITLLNQRQKLVKLADSSELGWKVVNEYTQHQLASDSEDEKKIYKAEARAVRKLKQGKQKKSRFQPYGAPSTSSSKTSSPAKQQFSSGDTGVRRPGSCFACGRFGHWRSECKAVQGHAKIPVVTSGQAEKISTDMNCLYVSEGAHIAESSSGSNTAVDVGVHVSTGSDKSPIGGLRASINQWKLAGASEYVLDVIENGYKIPFLTQPESVCLKNNKSALDNSDFVRSEISKLLDKGCISEVSDRPLVVNPLTVSCKKDKKRLVLDCRHINPHMCKYKCKFEGSSVARQMFRVGDCLFTFDLKSAYHHIEIHPCHKTYLGFSFVIEGQIKYFVFNVLKLLVFQRRDIFSRKLPG